ncbi:hypothetical protein [Sporocytophaga myxococcoides]|uniref:hypothetical protein n=1 Tax=Sporocytophaga myxococcoides TaxID=153721 RepID=UPI000412C969|nr:hypothetical protein [Sporocytophaga myxococcoides]
MQFKIGFIFLLVILTSCINHDKELNDIVIRSLKVGNCDYKDASDLVYGVNDPFLSKELPLGYPDLFTFNFPDKWEMGTIINDGCLYPGNFDYGNCYDNFLNNKVQYYYEQYFLLPSCSTVIDTALVHGDSIGLSIVNNVKFRLPDFKQYKVYFSYRFYRSVEVPFARFGTLVLYDKKSNYIKFIELYKDEAKDNYAFSQYFYIDKNYNIRIRSFYNDEIYIYPTDKTISLEHLVSEEVYK